jgi:hypothetical protein
MPGPSTPPPASSANPSASQDRFQCDFCGEAVSRVRRVALDQGYDRLSQRHAVRYACSACSERKDAERQPPVDGSAPSV